MNEIFQTAVYPQLSERGIVPECRIGRKLSETEEKALNFLYTEAKKGKADLSVLASGDNLIWISVRTQSDFMMNGYMVKNSDGEHRFVAYNPKVAISLQKSDSSDPTIPVYHTEVIEENERGDIVFDVATETDDGNKIAGILTHWAQAIISPGSTGTENNITSGLHQILMACVNTPFTKLYCNLG